MSENKRKKIIYIITKSNFGGAQRYVFDLATGVPNGYYDVVVALGGKGVLKEKLKKSGIRTIDIENLGRDINIFKEVSVFFDLIKLFKKEKPDIVHLNSSKIGGLGALAGRLSGVRNIIFTGHGWAFNEDRNPISKIIIFILHTITVILSDKTIAVSEKTKSQITYRVPFLKKKIPVIYNGIGNADFIQKKDARNHLISLEKTGEISRGAIWIGTTGELHHIKGHEYLINAISEIRDFNIKKRINVLIMGEGEERKHLEQLIRDKQLNKNIFLLGWVDDAKKYLKALDIFVFPSLSEAFPYSILTAGQAGLPIVASKVGGIPEVIENEVNGVLVSPRDVFELRDKIDELIQNKEKAMLYGSRIQDIVSTKFSIEGMIEKTLNVYRS